MAVLICIFLTNNDIEQRSWAMKTILSSWAKCLFKFVAHFKNWVVVVFLVVLALFINAQNWRQHIYPSTGRWINKIWSIHSMIFSAIKKNELLIHSTVMLSGRWKVHMILFIWPLGKGKTIGAGTRSVVGQRWGKRQFFPRSSLGLTLPALILLYPCLCLQPWIQYQLKLEFLIQKYKHEVSLILIMEVAGQRAFLLALYYCSWVGSVFLRISVPLHLPIILLSRESKPGCWLGRQLSGCLLRTECCAGSIRILNHSG